MLSQQRLKELFLYQDDGTLIYIATRKRPCTETGNPYKKVTIEKTRYALHRVIWTWHYGEIPHGLQVDHIDRNPKNNRIENLRLVTPSQNARNRANPPSKTGVTGLLWKPDQRMYRAVVTHNGQRICLGSSKDKHRLIWLLHLYRVGLYDPTKKVLAPIASQYVHTRSSRVTAQLMR